MNVVQNAGFKSAGSSILLKKTIMMHPGMISALVIGSQVTFMP